MSNGPLKPLVLYAAIAAVLLFPVLRDWDSGNLGGKDWNAFLGQAQAEATTLLDEGQFPAWNPWRRGGQVSFAQPESMFLSPVTPLALLFGANDAFKLLLLPLFLIAAMGMWALAGELGLRGVARALPGAVFIGASVFPLYVNGGLPNWLCGMAILPWLVVASRRAESSWRWLVAGGLLFAALLFCGNVHHFVFFPILLALEAFGRAWKRRSARPLLTTAALGISGIAFSLVRLVPLLELFSEFPRRLDASGRFMPLGQVARSLLLPHPEDIDGPGRIFVAGGSALYWVDCGAFIGPFVALLALIGALAAWRRAWPFVLVGGAFLWLALGSGVSVSAWDALRRLPVYESMQAPERFMGFVAFALALLAGFGGERILEWIDRIARRAGLAQLTSGSVLAPAIVMAGVVVPLLVVNAPITRGAFPVPPPEGVAPSTLFDRAESRPPFRQGRFAAVPKQWGGPLYEPVLRNVGNPDGQSDVPSQRAAKASDELGYRGELFLAEGKGTVSGEITPNRIRVRAQLDAPDLLVVNQTWYPGWELQGSRDEKCRAREGLIALPLEAGHHELELVYAPATIELGAWLSFGAIAIALLAGRARRARSGSQPLAVPVDRTALALHAGFVVVAVAWYSGREPSGAGAPPPPWREGARTVAPETAGTSTKGDALQQVVAAATVGEILRLEAGEHGPVVLRRGVTLVADPAGSARVASLTIADVPEAEHVNVVGVAIAGAGVVRVERCAGVVVIVGVARGEVVGGVAGGTNPLELSGVHSTQLFVFGDGDADNPSDELRVRLEQCRASFARCRFAAAVANAPSISAAASVVLLNACRFAATPGGSTSSAVELSLARGSLARTSGTPVAKQEVDADSGLFDLDIRPFGLSMQPGTEADRPTFTIVGPSRSKGTLIVARAPAFTPLRGKNSGQFLLCAFDSRQTTFPFELDASGRQTLHLPPFDDFFAPGDGLFVQASIPEPGELKAQLYSLIDAHLVVSPAE